MIGTMNKKSLLCSLDGAKKEDAGEDPGCFYLDFGDAGGSVYVQLCFVNFQRFYESIFRGADCRNQCWLNKNVLS